MGVIPGSGRSPGVGNDNPLQYSCLETPMDRGAWWASVHRVAKSQTQLKQLSAHTWGIGFPGGTGGREPTCQCRRCKRCGFDPQVGKISWRRAWQPSPVFLPRESQGERLWVGYSPLGQKELDTTEATQHAQGTVNWSHGSAPMPGEVKIGILHQFVEDIKSSVFYLSSEEVNFLSLTLLLFMLARQLLLFSSIENLATIPHHI